ncbi:alpha/beta hydrolase [Oceanobacter mangrovi]|uniref:alpha/beta hydrolase n=1 Tax=Oceanobacter mangrovi TaxID=2862510 RepID=UPI001FECFF85|nr:alpha/beta hydrolase [Oceanobacter mangrovi]
MNRIFAVMIFGMSSHISAEESIVDTDRHRVIPIEISFPLEKSNCSVESQCPVVFFSAGYGVSHTKYHFLSDLFAELGYLVVAIGHELPGDPPLSVSGNLLETRSENWRRGSDTLKVVRNVLRGKNPEYNFDHLLLAGHSNGGDISAWLANESPEFIGGLITLDHRRVPLPRSGSIAVLSVRASDFEADAGVLPSEAEQTQYGSCIVKIPNARHNDISDLGPKWLKTSIQRIVRGWLTNTSCQLRV